MQTLIVIQGPTACGKTALSIQLAKQLQTVVISADSRQFYKEMTIGTAKPTVEEMQGVTHYFIDSHSISEHVSAAEFENKALKMIQTQLSQYKFIVLVGGSGMFIDALCKGLDPIPKDEKTQNTLREEYRKNGLEPLLKELEEKDPEMYLEIDKYNPVRILRALEVIRFTSKKFSLWRAQKPAPRPFQSYYFEIDLPREELYKRIDKRVDTMIKMGLEQEVKNLLPYKHLIALQTVGYSEFFDYFKGNYTIATCIEKIKQHTRNYAKRQVTWFKRNESVYKLTYSSTEEQLQEVLQVIQNKLSTSLE